MELHFSIVNILNSMLYDKRKIIFEERLKNLSWFLSLKIYSKLKYKER